MRNVDFILAERKVRVSRKRRRVGLSKEEFIAQVLIPCDTRAEPKAHRILERRISDWRSRALMCWNQERFWKMSQRLRTWQCMLWDFTERQAHMSGPPGSFGSFP
jgi:hypothetical protein